eukprot:TRINITY_DN90197_c0_g1_i1.p1 TRINITY_DN90197_c0_g1~~TRINITY_DN90197_c0_g1_i1.p1  ORF type:complete len:1187 (+),score=326.87 TRINITY_DN90197_c0_g1_i1:160-3720(+)
MTLSPPRPATMQPVRGREFTALGLEDSPGPAQDARAGGALQSLHDRLMSGLQNVSDEAHSARLQSAMQRVSDMEQQSSRMKVLMEESSVLAVRAPAATTPSWSASPLKAKALEARTELWEMLQACWDDLEARQGQDGENPEGSPRSSLLVDYPSLRQDDIDHVLLLHTGIILALHREVERFRQAADQTAKMPPVAPPSSHVEHDAERLREQQSAFEKRCQEAQQDLGDKLAALSALSDQVDRCIQASREEAQSEAQKAQDAAETFKPSWLKEEREGMAALHQQLEGRIKSLEEAVQLASHGESARLLEGRQGLQEGLQRHEEQAEALAGLRGEVCRLSAQVSDFVLVTPPRDELWQALQAQREALEKRHDSAELRLETLATGAAAKEEVEQRLLIHKESLLELEQRHDELQRLVRDQSKALRRESEQRFDEVQRAVPDHVDSLRYDLDQLQEELQRGLSEKAKDLRAELDKRCKEFQRSLTDVTESWQGPQRQLQGDVRELQEESEASKEVLRTFRGELTSVVSRLESRCRDLERAMAASTEDYHEGIASARQQLTAMHEELAHSCKELQRAMEVGGERTNQSIEGLKKQTKSLGDQLDAKTIDVESTVHALGRALDCRMDKVEQEVLSVERKALASSDAHGKAMSEHGQSTKLRLADLEDQVLSLRSKCQAVEESVEDSVQDQVDRLQKGLREEIKGVKGSVADADKALATLQCQNEATERRLGDFELLIYQEEKSRSSLSLEVNKWRKEQAALREHCRDVHSDLRSRAEELATRLSETQGQCAKADGRLGDLEPKLNKLVESNVQGEKASDFKEGTSKLMYGMVDEVAGILERLASADRSLDACSTRLEKLETHLETLSQDATRATERTLSADKRLQCMTQEVDSLRQRVGAADAQQVASGAEMTRLLERITEVDKTLSRYDGTTLTLKAHSRELEGRVGALEERAVVAGTVVEASASDTVPELRRELAERHAELRRAFEARAVMSQDDIDKWLNAHSVSLQAQYDGLDQRVQRLCRREEKPPRVSFAPNGSADHEEKGVASEPVAQIRLPSPRPLAEPVAGHSAPPQPISRSPERNTAIESVTQVDEKRLEAGLFHLPRMRQLEQRLEKLCDSSHEVHRDLREMILLRLTRREVVQEAANLVSAQWKEFSRVVDVIRQELTVLTEQVGDDPTRPRRLSLAYTQ